MRKRKRASEKRQTDIIISDKEEKQARENAIV